MAAQRKPKVEFYWSLVKKTKDEKATERAANKAMGLPHAAILPSKHVVNWRLVGANGEVMCQCTQGFRDKADAKRNLDTCTSILYWAGNSIGARIIGPGRKPV